MTRKSAASSRASDRVFRPSRARGQCFLTDTTVVDRIVATIAPANGEPLLEIGAGSGQLSLPLARAGATLVALETDSVLADALNSKLRDEPQLKVEVVREDFFNLKLESWLTEHFSSAPRICGNLPYSVASAILLKLLEYPKYLRKMHLMFQLEVAERLAAQPGSKAYGYLSVMTQRLMEAKISFAIPPHAFRPRPRVQSGLAQLVPRPEPVDVGDARLFETIVKGLFRHRRKTIANNLSFFRSLGVEPAEVRSVLEELDISASLRAEMLSVDAFAAISRRCASLR